MDRHGTDKVDTMDKTSSSLCINKPVETLESIRHKFNSTAKWLKAMGIIS